MSKLLKFLGIGTAIGTVVYGVIKYKNDQKFKEKVDGVVEKAEEKADNALCKAGDFINKHPGLFTMSILAITTIPCVIHAVNADKRRQEMMQRAYEDFRNDTDEECERINEEARAAAQKQMMMDDIMANPSGYVVVSKNEWEKYQDAQKDVTNEINTNWTEDYRDTWDEIHELVDRIDLAPGETYVLEEASQLGVEANKPVISHLVYGTGCYPPEVDEDRFID